MSRRKDFFKNINLQEDKKSDKKRKVLVGLLALMIILVMVSSVLVYWSEEQDDGENSIEYNGLFFQRVQGGWITRINNQQILFEYQPIEVANISSVFFNLNELGKEVYILVNPAEKSFNDYDVSKVKALLNYFGKSGFFSCTNDENCGDLPVIKCDENLDIIYLKNGDEDKIYKDGNCLVLQSEEHSRKTISFFMYKLFGVI